MMKATPIYGARLQKTILIENDRRRKTRFLSSVFRIRMMRIPSFSAKYRPAGPSIEQLGSRIGNGICPRLPVSIAAVNQTKVKRLARADLANRQNGHLFLNRLRSWGRPPRLPCRVYFCGPLPTSGSRAVGTKNRGWVHLLPLGWLANVPFPR